MNSGRIRFPRYSENKCILSLSSVKAKEESIHAYKSGHLMTAYKQCIYMLMYAHCSDFYVNQRLAYEYRNHLNNMVIHGQYYLSLTKSGVT